MKRFLTIFGLTITIACSGQDDSLKLRVYSDFINADIFSYDSMFSKTTELILVTTVDKFESTIDIKYLEDFLNDNIENNEIYKSTFFGRDPSIYFDIPPTFGLGETLKKDKQLGELLVQILQTSKSDLSTIKGLETNYQIKTIKDSKAYFKMGWDKFHKKYHNCYGIIRLTDIIFNDDKDRAVMYVENFKGSLDASGDIIVMRKIKDTWIIELQINQWMS